MQANNLLKLLSSFSLYYSAGVVFLPDLATLGTRQKFSDRPLGLGLKYHDPPPPPPPYTTLDSYENDSVTEH